MSAAVAKRPRCSACGRFHQDPAGEALVIALIQAARTVAYYAAPMARPHMRSEDTDIEALRAAFARLPKGCWRALERGARPAPGGAL